MVAVVERLCCFHHIPELNAIQNNFRIIQNLCGVMVSSALVGMVMKKNKEINS